MKEDLNKWKDTVHGSETVRIAMFLKLIYKLNTIPIKIPTVLFKEIASQH